jgi:hypothetical protein
MADGGKINEWFEKTYNLREISKRSPFLIELNNYNCAKNIKKKNSQVEIIKLVNNRVSQPISYVLVIKNWASVDELKNIYTECSSHIISYGFTSNEQIAEYRKMDSKMAMGGETKFKDKVESIKASLLKRKKVAPKVQKDYGKTYSPKEAKESAQRIVGSMVSKMKEKVAKRKKK